MPVPSDADLSPAQNAALVIELTDRYLESAARQESLRLMRAVRLAPDLETCEEILRTGRVPRSRLDPVWARRYGLA